MCDKLRSDAAPPCISRRYHSRKHPIPPAWNNDFYTKHIIGPWSASSKVPIQGLPGSRDKVYGLLGLIKSSVRSRLAEDYSLHTSAVYAAAMKAIIVDGRDEFRCFAGLLWNTQNSSSQILHQYIMRWTDWRYTKFKMLRKHRLQYQHVIPTIFQLWKVALLTKSTKLVRLLHNGVQLSTTSSQNNNSSNAQKEPQTEYIQHNTDPQSRNQTRIMTFHQICTSIPPFFPCLPEGEQMPEVEEKKRRIVGMREGQIKRENYRQEYWGERKTNGKKWKEVEVE